MFLSIAVLASLLGPAPDTGRVAVTLAPQAPLIESDPSAPGSPQFLNFDLLVHNGRSTARTLQGVRLTVVDAEGRLTYQRFCDGSGISPCNATLPDREIPAGRDAILYNPFHTLPGDLTLTELRYELIYADPAGAEVDTAKVTVRPVREPTAAVLLPLVGRLLVFDGHDALSHHRRWNLAHPVIRTVGFTGNSGRYAYDLSLVDSTGRMFRGTGDRNADWYSWEAPVRAPASGRIVAMANDEPDWEVRRTSLPDSVIFARPIALYGNYVVIAHDDGTFSMIAHLRKGSVRVKVDDRVTAGQQLAQVGFSGSVYTIHTHYQLQSGAAYSAEGLPSYFRQARRLGVRPAPYPASAPAIRLDTGDLVESR